MRRRLVLVTAFGVGAGVGCGNPSPAKIDAPPMHDAKPDGMKPPIDAAIDAPPDAPLGPCSLPALNMTVATLAGCGEPGTMDGERGLVRFNNPVNLALDSTGIAYVADFDSSHLRRVDLTGATTTVYNMPQTFRRPFGIIMTPGGFLYIETDDDDMQHHSTNTGTLWKFEPSTATATVVLRDHQRPRGLALLSDGRIATTDNIHHVIEIIDPTLGTATPLAGTFDVAGHNNATGAAATFSQPWDLVVDTNGDLIVSEFGTSYLRKVTLAGVVTDYAGTGVAGHLDAALATAQFNQPKGMTRDAAGNIYVSDSGSHVIRKIAGGMVTTIAGVVGTEDLWHDDNDPLAAQFGAIEGLDISADGHRLVVADGNNGDGLSFNRVRVVTLP